jgi:predicted nucleic acid-binding protein
MVCYAVIDTNVLISSLLSSHDDAATVLTVGKLFSGEVIPVYSNEIMNEYKEVLRRTKFHFT